MTKVECLLGPGLKLPGVMASGIGPPGALVALSEDPRWRLAEFPTWSMVRVPS